MASYVLNGHTYSLSVVSGTDGLAYSRAEPFTGSGATLWDMFFTDLFGQIATAISGNGISPGAQYSTVRSNGTNWVSVAGVTPSTDFSAALPVAKGGTDLSALGTALQYLRTNSAATAMEWGSAAVPSFALLNGGTIDVMPGTWAKRTLNTEVYDPDNIVSLAASVFTLIAGTYIVLAETTGWAAEGYTADFSLRLRNTTDSTTTYTGQSYRAKSKADPAEISAACVTMQAQFVITSSKSFELQQDGGGYAVTGGTSSGSAETQKYATILIIKIA